MTSEISHSTVKLSVYASRLAPDAKARYVAKLSHCKCDCPYFFPDSFWNYGKKLYGTVPPISRDEIFLYLIIKHSSLTEESFRAYKNLKADEYLSNGWIMQLGSFPLINGNVVIKAKVAHSQSLNDPPLNPWAVLSKVDGSVIAGHCDCVAGYLFFISSCLQFKVNRFVLCIVLGKYAFTLVHFFMQQLPTQRW